MKKLLLLFLVTSFSTFLFAQNFSIRKGVKQGVENPKSPDAIVQVHYDGDNDNNAVGDGGTTFFAAAKYRSDLFTDLIGGEFQSVDFYIQDMPTGLTLYVWDHTGDPDPGTVLEMQSIDLGTITADSWNTVTLSSPITITGDILWVGLEIEDATGNAFPLGIDAGPNDPDGDYVNDAGTWDHLADFGIPTNWNIRANVNVTSITVSFSVNMNVQITNGNFDPAAGDSVVIRGSFQTEAGDPGGDWQGVMFNMTDGDADGIYDLDVVFPDTSDGKSFAFKFVIMPGDGWESTPDRPFTVTAPSVVLPTVYFNNDEGTNPSNTFNFTADISGILGIGAGGAFDGDQDSLLVMGLDWNGGVNVSGDRKMVVDPFNAGIYRATLSVEATSDSTSWKFKAFPDARFSNGGWETGSDRFATYGPDGSVIDLPTIVPRIFPIFDTLANDINVTFNVDMSNPVNQYNDKQVDPSTLEFVGMRGGASFLGDWSSGCWCPTDTIGNPPTMYVLTDMGNNMYSRTVFIPGGTEGGGVFEYKYAMMYPGADTVNGGSSPLDNEGGFGVNHNFVLADGPDIVLNNFFGDFTTSVEKLEDYIPTRFELEQNYPNPFNPSTKIRYTVTEAGLVTLKVYNLLGQEVATLLNEEQTSGVYEATFNAEQFSSGIYFYTLTAGSFTATKKMILMK
jgi:Secretion system C-terminal sorting domain